MRQYPRIPQYIIVRIFGRYYLRREQILKDLSVLADEHGLPYRRAFCLVTTDKEGKGEINKIVKRLLPVYEELTSKYKVTLGAFHNKLQEAKELLERGPPKQRKDIDDLRRNIPFLPNRRVEEPINNRQYSWLRVIITHPKATQISDAIIDEPEAKRALDKIIAIRKEIIDSFKAARKQRNAFLAQLRQYFKKQIRPAERAELQANRKTLKEVLAQALNQQPSINSFLNKQDIARIAIRINNVFFKLKNKYDIKKIDRFIGNGLFSRKDLQGPDINLWIGRIEDNLTKLRNLGLKRVIVSRALLSGWSFEAMEDIFRKYPHITIRDLTDLLSSAATP